VTVAHKAGCAAAKQGKFVPFKNAFWEKAFGPYAAQRDQSKLGEANISWNPVFCKRCDICVEICPKDTLVLRNDAIVEEQNCILCGLCARYCPDIAIEMLPEAVAAHAAKGGTPAESC